MAALMHYFMLATFTLFAVQAFHICLQLYTGGKINIRHYMLKVSITSWGKLYDTMRHKKGNPFVWQFILSDSGRDIYSPV